MILSLYAIIITIGIHAQNVGINTLTPAGKLHIKGSADISQLVIDAHSTQSNISPLIRLRNSNGNDLMWIHSDNVFNTFIGYNTGRVNNLFGGGGLYNTFIGNSAGYSNTTGSSNTANGVDAMHYNSAGSDNTANGLGALFVNTTASQNTAIGGYALFNQSYNPGTVWNSGNTAVGYQALYLNSPTSTANGISNTAVGHSALRVNTTGYDNTAVGASALYTNNTGRENTGIGRQSLFYNTTGSDNTAIGYKSLRSNDDGWYNTASGNYALFSNTSGISNTASGYYALYGNTMGNWNTAFGMYALRYTTGNSNTAIGLSSLDNLYGGSNNIAVGSGSGNDPGSPNVNNTISIGNNGWLNGASNQVFLGNSSSSWIGGWQLWTKYSDSRIKTRVTEGVVGLEFIKKLRPVTYYMSIKTAALLTHNKEIPDFPEKYDVEKIKYSGFLAQEVEKAANESGYDFDGVHKPKNDHDLYSLSYESFIMPLVKGMQEQQVIIDELKKSKEYQQQQLNTLLKEIQLIKEKIK